MDYAVGTEMGFFGMGYGMGGIGMFLITALVVFALVALIKYIRS